MDACNGRFSPENAKSNNTFRAADFPALWQQRGLMGGWTMLATVAREPWGLDSLPGGIRNDRAEEVWRQSHCQSNPSFAGLMGRWGPIRSHYPPPSTAWSCPSSQPRVFALPPLACPESPFSEPPTRPTRARNSQHPSMQSWGYQCEFSKPVEFHQLPCKRVRSSRFQDTGTRNG